MGYTHYWHRLPSLPADKFAAASADCRKLCDALPIPLGGGDGEGSPEFTPDRVWFNGHVQSGSFSRDGGGLMWPVAKAEGVATIGTEAQAGHWFAGPMASARCVDENGDGSYETFGVELVLSREVDEDSGDAKGRIFDCCKTNYRPYDLNVQCCLIVLKEHLGDMIRVSSDGEDEQWNEARNACQVILGYGLTFQLDGEASPDTLPDKPKKIEEPLPPIDRNEAIKRIRTALRKRSGKAWSVTGGRGTAWGWIKIDAPPARCKWRMVPTGENDHRGFPIYRDEYAPDAEFGNMGPQDREELKTLLGLSNEVHFQGASIPAASDYYWEWIDRAEGREPRCYGEQYWD